MESKEKRIIVLLAICVSLVLLGFGCIKIERKVESEEYQYPTVNIIATQTFAYASPLKVSFRASTNDADGHVTSYIWRINGETRKEQTTSYNFDDAGTYTVALTVTDNDGLNATDCINVTVFTSSIPAPSPHPTGLTWDGEHLWVSDSIAKKIYKISPTDGSLVKSFSSPGRKPSGLAWDGTSIWCSDNSFGRKRIYQVDTSNGNVIDVLRLPLRTPKGITYMNGDLWCQDHLRKRILKIDPNTGSISSMFRIPHYFPTGMAWDGKHLWCTDNNKKEIYMVDPASGSVIFLFPAPGLDPHGLTWDGEYLWVADSKDGKIYKINVNGTKYILTNPIVAQIRLINRVDNNAPSNPFINTYFAIPPNTLHQRIEGTLTFTPSYFQFTEDEWGQKIACYNRTVSISQEICGWEGKAVLYDLRYLIFPERVNGEIPKDILENYTADAAKYKINDPLVQETMKKVIGDENNLYWKARKLHDYLIEHIEYETTPGWEWDDAPTVLKRGKGSCSEYTFAYIALCRAAGVPARYIGGTLFRKTGIDREFHRFVEIYLPSYGWIPVDVDADDIDPKVFPNIFSTPAVEVRSFGAISHNFLITTVCGGPSNYMGWTYNLRDVNINSDPGVEFDGWAEWQHYKKEDLTVRIIKPEDKNLYLNDKEKKVHVKNTLIIGKMAVELETYSKLSSISRVEFYVDGMLRHVDSTAPYQWQLDYKLAGKHTLKVVAYDEDSNFDIDKIEAKFFIF